MNVSPIIRVRCPECDFVEVPAPDITLRHCLDDESWEYWFECPNCHRRATGHSNWWLSLEAYAVGSALEVWRYPDELREEHAGPPLNLQDLIAFHLALAEPDWIDELVRAPGSSSFRPPRA